MIARAPAVLFPIVLFPALLSILPLLSSALPAAAQEAYLQPPAAMDPQNRCTYFSRLYRFTEQSKSMCDDGRQVRIGPVTTVVLDQCRKLQGDRFDRVPVTDMMDAFGRQIARDGMGNACHEVGAQAWDLLSQ